MKLITRQVCIKCGKPWKGDGSPSTCPKCGQASVSISKDKRRKEGRISQKEEVHGFCSR